MVERKICEIPVFQFEQLNGQKQLNHFVTSRRGGVSKSKYQSLNFSYKVGDKEQHVKENRNSLAEALAIQPKYLLFPDQCHTRNVYEVKCNSKTEDLLSTDALITNCRNICISVLTADCVPILLFDPVMHAVGIVHSGWKGTVSRIAARTIEKMVKIYGSKPQNVLVCIGPSISQKHYEVGSEVARQFEFWFADTPSIFIRNPATGKTHINLWEANIQLLLRQGILKRNIEISDICTYENSSLFFSARRDGYHCGRFASGIMLI